MAFFSSRKRPEEMDFEQPEGAEPVAPVLHAPAPKPSAPVAKPLLGAGLRLVAPPNDDAASGPAHDDADAAVVDLPVPPSEPRGEDLRSLPLGTILFRQGLVGEQELAEALAAGMESGERLGEVLIRRGLVTEDDLGRCLAAQQGLAFLHGDELTIDREIAELLPLDEVRALGALAVRAEGDAVLVVSYDPSKKQRDRIEQLLGRRAHEVVVSRTVFAELLRQLEEPDAPELVTPMDDEPVVDEPVADETKPDVSISEEKEPEMDQVWTGPDEVEETPVEAVEAVVEDAGEAFGSEPATLEEMWGQAPETAWAEPEQAQEAVVENWAAEEVAETPESEPEQDVPVLEPAAEAVVDEAPAVELDHGVVAERVGQFGAEHETSVGRIDELLHRIQNGASSFAQLREQLNDITGKLHVAEGTIAERDQRLSELGQAHESAERRIEELVDQLREREEALSGLGNRVEELTGRLSSTEQRLEERSRFVDELSQQVERRDAALGAFEERLAALAAQFESFGA